MVDKLADEAVDNALQGLEMRAAKPLTFTGSPQF